MRLNAAVGRPRHATPRDACGYVRVHEDFIPPIRLKQNKIKGETKRGVRFPREFHNTFLNRATGIALHARFIMSFVRARTNNEFTLPAFEEEERGDTCPRRPRKIQVTRSRVTFSWLILFYVDRKKKHRFRFIANSITFNRLKFVILHFEFLFLFVHIFLSVSFSIYTSWKYKDIYREAHDRRARSLGYFRFID